MNRLNSYDMVIRKAAQEQEARRKRVRSGVVDAKRGTAVSAKKLAAKKPASKNPGAMK